MLREVAVEEISDGKLYGPDDYVPVGCGGCRGCSDCCRKTGDSIILDPYDMYLLEKGTGRRFTDMIEKEIEIRLVDGLILPNLMEHDEQNPSREDGCPFLDRDGRCGIHAFRPSFCRMFPMGRYYPDQRSKTAGRSFYYILQKDECPRRTGERVRLRDWLDIADLDRYERFTADWHKFLRTAGGGTALLSERSADQVQRRILQIFYVQPYRTDRSFYPQYDSRRQRAGEVLRALPCP